MAFRSERLDPESHDVRDFTCGEASLDTWLCVQAVAATARRTARTWVWVDPAGVVVGYYALAAHKIAREDVPPKIGRGGPSEIPAVLLARLALSSSLRGQGLGAVARRRRARPDRRRRKDGGREACCRGRLA